MGPQVVEQAVQQTLRHYRLVLAVASGLAALLVSTAWPQTGGGASPNELTNSPVLLAPTQGRPVFVEPGGSFRVVMHLPQPPDSVRFELAAWRFPAQRHELGSQASDAEALQGIYELTVPADTPEQTYDLEIHAGNTLLAGRHAVAVTRVGRRVRLVQLSDMNIGELGAPDFDARLIAEVNLLAPTLIVATGDFLDATHPDPEAGWQRLADFLACFDAPTLVACGDYDDVALYSRFMAPSPIGTIEVGACRGVVLYDVPGRPITDDASQIGWVERLLGDGDRRLHFVVAHEECPNLLRHWENEGTLTRMLAGGRLGLWFAGGPRDWDGRSYRGLVDAAAPLLYLGTHQSSTAARQGADGVTHYRVVDLDGVRAIPYGPLTAQGIHASIAVGRLQTVFEEPNDGRQERMTLTAVSGLPFRVDGLSARVLVKRTESEPLWCHGARLARFVDLGAVWECWLAFDLPDKGALRAVVGTGAEPDEPQVDVQFDTPRALSLKVVTSDDGVSHQTTDWAGTLRLVNTADRTAVVSPLVRLDGGSVPYRVAEAPGPLATAYRLRLEPGQAVTLQPDLSVLRIEPGRRELQVYVQGGRAYAPATWPLDVRIAR